MCLSLLQILIPISASWPLSLDHSGISSAELSAPLRFSWGFLPMCRCLPNHEEEQFNFFKRRACSLSIISLATLTLLASSKSLQTAFSIWNYGDLGFCLFSGILWGLSAPCLVTAQTIQKVRGGLCNRYQLGHTVLIHGAAVLTGAWVEGWKGPALYPAGARLMDSCCPPPGIVTRVGTGASVAHLFTPTPQEAGVSVVNSKILSSWFCAQYYLTIS